MYEKAMNELKEKGLNWERVYENACKSDLKRGFYTEYYVENGKGEYICLQAYIRGFREMSVEEARELRETRVRYYLIYTNSFITKEKKEHPIRYQHVSDMIADKNKDRNIELYNKFYFEPAWKFIGVVIKRHEAFDIVKNLFLQEISNLEAESKKIPATEVQPILDNIKVEKLDVLADKEEEKPA